jgi:LysM repeat protein
VDALKAQNQLSSDEVKVGQKLVVVVSAGSMKGQVLGPATAQSQKPNMGF